MLVDELRDRTKQAGEPPIGHGRSATVPPISMNKIKFSKRTVATPGLDAAALAEQKGFDRLRRRANQRLLKRRQRKSGQ